MPNSACSGSWLTVRRNALQACRLEPVERYQRVLDLLGEALHDVVRARDALDVACEILK